MPCDCHAHMRETGAHARYHVRRVPSIVWPSRWYCAMACANKSKPRWSYSPFRCGVLFLSNLKTVGLSYTESMRSLLSMGVFSVSSCTLKFPVLCRYLWIGFFLQHFKHRPYVCGEFVLEGAAFYRKISTVRKNMCLHVRRKEKERSQIAIWFSLGASITPVDRPHLMY